MRKTILFLLIVLSTTSFYTQTKDSEVTFIPLKEKETLDFERKKAPLLWDLEVSIRNSKTNDKKVVGIYTMFEGTALLNDSKNRLFFTARDKDDNSLLWYVNGKKGSVQRLMNVSPSFAISNDGKYVIYYETWEQMKKAGREIEKISLFNIDLEKIVQEIIPKNTTSSMLNISSLIYSDLEKKFLIEIGYDDVVVITEELFIPEE